MLYFLRRRMVHDDLTYDDPIAVPSSAPDPEGSHLFVAFECERPLAGGARYSLAGVDEIAIGRGTARGARRTVEGGRRKLLVSIPDRRISGAHGKLVRDRDRWTYQDLKSTNGSLLNGVPFTEGLVDDGDLLQAGHTVLFLRDTLVTPHGSTDDVDSGEMAQGKGMRTLLPRLARDFESLTKVAASKVSALLFGETGTGKEVLARKIHALSRGNRPFVAVNCGAIPDALVESQLFGHVKGAFSGAVRDEPGFVRAADGGTLFLDEIAELPSAAQAALLRVLQESEVVPVGSTRAIPVDLRVVAATHRSLDALVAQGTFRADLLARLGGWSFHLPPLRDRREDLGVIVADLLPRLGAVKAIEPAAALALLAYDWPYNVRELEKALSLAVVLADGGAIALGHLPAPVARAYEELRGAAPHEDPEDAALRATLIGHLERTRGNVTEVARAMGKARQQIHRWLRRMKIDARGFRP